MWIIGTTILGGILGSIAGGLYGFAMDKSDLPMMPIFTIPMGALIGGFLGVVTGVLVF